LFASLTAPGNDGSGEGTVIALTAENRGRLTGARAAEQLRAGPTVIDVDGVSKTFTIPRNRMDSLRERLANPFAHREATVLRALENVSFDVHSGEFFGIVGRNGSGKSTLLKIMASIYRPDAGRVRMAGRLAPFIELGVGFNPELTSRENVVLNGVLMGLTRREARRRLDSVLDFAELREFTDMKLKNYSSGMMVRLAFSVMVNADADVMLIDEVLAVGDAAFGQKCLDVFTAMRSAGRTIVLVTHDMSMVQRFCHRAALIHDSKIQYVGDPEETALRYYRLNFGGDPDEIAESGTLPEVNAKVIDVWLENANGERTQNVEQGQQMFFNCIIEARRDLRQPVFSYQFLDSDGVEVFGFSKRLKVDDEAEDVLQAGRRVLISGEVENRLLPGRYRISQWVIRNRTQGDLALHSFRLLEFIVYGTEDGSGHVKLDDSVEARLLDPE
jgi:ABC-type polysaccharide/polyol phosphate transport system ATPase subunit